MTYYVSAWTFFLSSNDGEGEICMTHCSALPFFWWQCSATPRWWPFRKWLMFFITFDDLPRLWIKGPSFLYSLTLWICLWCSLITNPASQLNQKLLRLFPVSLCNVDLILKITKMHIKLYTSAIQIFFYSFLSEVMNYHCSSKAWGNFLYLLSVQLANRLRHKLYRVCIVPLLGWEVLRQIDMVEK